MRELNGGELTDDVAVLLLDRRRGTGPVRRAAQAAAGPRAGAAAAGRVPALAPCGAHRPPLYGPYGPSLLEPPPRRPPPPETCLSAGRTSTMKTMVAISPAICRNSIGDEEVHRDGDAEDDQPEGLGLLVGGAVGVLAGHARP